MYKQATHLKGAGTAGGGTAFTNTGTILHTFGNHSQALHYFARGAAMEDVTAYYWLAVSAAAGSGRNASCVDACQVNIDSCGARDHLGRSFDWFQRERELYAMSTRTLFAGGRGYFNKTNFPLFLSLSTRGIFLGSFLESNLWRT
jgi:hypothetical protein